jgi:hypothetical protein
MSDIPLDAPIVVSESLVSSDTGGEFVILNFETGRYHGLEGVGSLIWSLLNAGSTVRQIQAAILAEYDVDEAQCQMDVQRLLHELRERGLIDVRDIPGS